MGKTINEALKDLFIGLGGNSSALSDNDSVSDYIEDLESAIKASAGAASEDLIDDTEASETKTYSSSKIAGLIPSNELPTPSSTNAGKVATVVSDGEGGYTWSAENAPKELPSVTSSDNGNMLSVVNGAWAKGSNTIFIVFGHMGGWYYLAENGKSDALSATDLMSFINKGYKIYLYIKPTDIAGTTLEDQSLGNTIIPVTYCNNTDYSFSCSFKDGGGTYTTFVIGYNGSIYIFKDGQSFSFPT